MALLLSLFLIIKIQEQPVALSLSLFLIIQIQEQPVAISLSLFLIIKIQEQPMALSLSLFLTIKIKEQPVALLDRAAEDVDGLPGCERMVTVIIFFSMIIFDQKHISINI